MKQIELEIPGYHFCLIVTCYIAILEVLYFYSFFFSLSYQIHRDDNAHYTEIKIDIEFYLCDNTWLNIAHDKLLIHLKISVDLNFFFLTTKTFIVMSNFFIFSIKINDEKIIIMLLNFF